MKKIHLIRHAKSSWKDAALSDVDRPLNTRGIRACGVMAQPINDANCSFKHVFCSPALRAQSTIKLINSALAQTDVKWQVIDELYTFNSERLFEWCGSLDEALTEIVIVGHNPALTDFCNQLCHSNIKNIPTCGYAQLTAQENVSWKALSHTPFELTHFIKPKDIER